MKHYFKSLLLIFGFYFLQIGTGIVNIALAQTSTSFIRTFKAAGMNGGLSLAETSDGGFVGTGQHETSGAGSCDIYVYKVDDCGNPEWFKTYGGASEDGGKSIQQTSDGGYIVAALAHIGAGSYDITLLKIDAIGNVQWTKVFGGGGSDMGLHVQQTLDGGYIVSGFFTGLGFGAEDAALIKTDANGNLLWMKIYGGAGADWGDFVEQTSDGGYLLVGYTTSFGAGGYDIYVLKLDASGNIIWSKTYGGSGGDGSSQWGISGKVTADGGFMFCANTDSYGAGGNDVLLIKTDSLGSLQWSKTYGGTGDDQPRFAEQTPDGGFIIIGLTTSFGAGNLDAYLIKTDNNGNLQWSKAYGDTGSDRGSMVKQSPDGGYALSVVTSSFGAVYFDALFMKTDSLGVVGCYQNNCATVVNAVNPSVGSGANVGTPAASVAAPSIVANNYTPADYFLCLKCSIIPTFTYSTSTLCIGNTIFFYNNTTKGKKCTEWYVNGTTQGFQDTLSIIFTTQGLQKIQLVASCGNSTDTSSVSINVLAFDAPVASFNNNAACNGDTSPFIDNSVSTSGTISNWTWDFGDGSAINTTQSPSYIYPSPGTYNTLLTVLTTNGCTDTATKTTIVYPRPVVQFDTSIVCKGDTVQFNNLSTIISPGTIQSYNWDFGDGSPPSASQNPSHFFNAAGTYNVKLVAFSNMACKDSITNTIIINPAIHAESGFGNDTLCTGGTILLGANPTATGGIPPFVYEWSPAIGLNDSTIANPTATITSNILFEITITDSIGCKAFDSVFVIYNPSGPNAEAGFGNDTLCSGGMVLLGGAPTCFGGTAPYTYSWLPLSGLNNPSSPNPTATITANKTYLLTVTDANGCQDIDTVFLIYNATGPFANAGFGNNTLCTGGTVLLGGAPTASGGTSPYTYNWIPSAGLNNNAFANPTATITSNSTYVLIVSDATGCQNIDSVFLTYNANGPFADAGFGNNSLCTSGSLLLGGTPTGSGGVSPYTFLWLPATGLNGATLSNPVATVNANTNYVVIVNDGIGCQDIDTVSVIYNSNGPDAEAGYGSDTLCTGGIILLGGTPTATNGLPPYTYTWLPNSGLNSNAFSNPTASIFMDTFYVVCVSDANACQDIDTVFLNYNATGPFADAGFGNNTLCTGGTVLLGGAPTASGGISPYTYSWIPSAGLNNNTFANPTATITGNSTYVLIVSDATGCQNIDSVSLTYNANGPFADAGFGNNSLCTGGSLLLGGTPTGSGGVSPYTFLWLPAAGLNGATLSNPVATVNANSNYVVIVTDSDGCQNIDTVAVTYNSNGPVAEAGFGNNNLCTGGTILLGGSPTVVGGIAPYSYTWLPATGLNNASIANPLATLTGDTVYVIIITDVTGCQDIDSVAISYHPSGPFADAGIGNPALCYGYPIVLGGIPSASAGVSPYTYFWLPAAGLNSNIISNPTDTIGTSNTIYYLTVTDALGCSDLDSTYVAILGTGIIANFIATPNQGIEPLVVQFTNQSIGSGLSYQWNFGDNGTSTTENPYHIFYNSSDTAFNFLITLIATDTNGCIDTALLKALLVDPTNINTFPNVFTPNDDGVNDVFKFDLGNVSLVSAVIFNRWGQKILEWNTPLGGWDGRTASAEPAASGVYFYILTIMDKDKKSTQKLGSILLER